MAHWFHVYIFLLPLCKSSPAFTSLVLDLLVLLSILIIDQGTSNKQSGSVSTTRTVTSLLTCWSQNTEFPECPGSNHSCLNFNETHAVSPSKSLPPLGTRTSNPAELEGGEADYPQCILANLVITRTQSHPILCYPKDCSLPDSSALRIFQARILEQVAISYSRGSS